MKYMTAGESHGSALCAIIEGMPAGLKLDVNEINRQLKRRKIGYGRGGRMKIESDEMRLIAGVRGGVTLGSPIAFLIENADYKNWSEIMGADRADLSKRAVTAVRPGHADLTGCIKYGFDDARNVLERASARETAARVGVGAICRALLESVGIKIGSHVLSIGSVEAGQAVYGAEELIERADLSEVRCMDARAEAAMKNLIDEAKKSGDTLGGRVEVVISGMPAGVGSYVHYDRKLDGLLAGAFMGVQAIKAAEVGDCGGGQRLGSLSHDEIYPDAAKGFCRKTNRAGGIEGGMSNGEDIVIRAVMKPIPTLMSGLETVDLITGEAAKASPERSDVCAVPAAAVVLESVAACVIADELLRVTGGDTALEVAERVSYLRNKAVRKLKRGD